jgi:hypothetical protein
MKRAIAIFLMASLAAGGARAAMTTDEVKKQLESTYPVQVLSVTPTEIEGKPAFAARVMKTTLGGNDAFAVTVLDVDAESGKLISAFRHEASGYLLPESETVEPKQVLVPEHGHSTWR